jgi:hypothetical protein
MLPTLAPQNMTEAMEFSKILATSNMVPAAYKGKPQDILVAIGWGYEVGITAHASLAEHCRDQWQAERVR